MCHHHAVLAEFHKLRQHLLDGWRIDDHVITDTGQFLDIKGDGDLRVHKRGKALRDLSLLHLYRTDLNDLVFLRAESRRLQVKNDKVRLKILPPRIFHNVLGVIYQICFHTIDDFKIRSLWNRVVRHRKCLYRTVIRDCNTLMPEGDCLGNDIPHVGNTVHITHLRVTVQLHALVHGVVHSFCYKIPDLFNTHNGAYGQLMIKVIQCRYALDLDKCSF